MTPNGHGRRTVPEGVRDGHNKRGRRPDRRSEEERERRGSPYWCGSSPHGASDSRGTAAPELRGLDRSAAVSRARTAERSFALHRAAGEYRSGLPRAPAGRSSRPALCGADRSCTGQFLNRETLVCKVNLAEKNEIVESPLKAPPAA